MTVYLLVLSGFAVFFGLEQFLHWHHCHRVEVACRKPLTYLILIGDGLHNFLGGLAVAGTFLIDIRLGIITWLAAAAHEVPQELGDFGVLVPFAAGNFIYIGASDLIPEVKAHADTGANFVHFSAFGLGIGLMLLVKLVLEPGAS